VGTANARVMICSNRQPIPPSTLPVAWTIQLLPDLGVAEVQYSGVVRYRERCQAKADLAATLNGTGIRRALIDYTDARAAEEAVEELRKFLDDLASTEFLRGVKVAYAAAPMEHETASRAMARHVGYEFSGFRDRPAALAWLVRHIDPSDTGVSFEHTPDSATTWTRAGRP
jgi:hypothetical protein